MDFPGEWVAPFFISSIGRYSNLNNSYLLSTGQGSVSASTIGVTGQGMLIPITLPGPTQVSGFSVYNNTSGYNIDIGLYHTNPGQSTMTRVVATGATAQVLGVQTIGVSTTRIDRGTYYMAIVASNGLASFFSLPVATYGFGHYGCQLFSTGGTLTSTVTATGFFNTALRIPWILMHR